MPLPNPVLLFDNYFDGYRREYGWGTKFEIAEEAGFDGFNFAQLDVRSEVWSEISGLLDRHGFSHLGFYVMSDAVIDAKADTLGEEIERLRAYVRAVAELPTAAHRFVTLSLNGTDELDAPTIVERGSAKASERHWARGVELTTAFDSACRQHGVEGSLYPHVDWLTDTPEAVSKLRIDSDATHIGLGFTALHWYLHARSPALDQVFRLPGMEDLLYVALMNARGRPDGFDSRPLDGGDIDMAQILGVLWQLDYRGPIATQGYLLGGDPYANAKRAIDYLSEVRQRFEHRPAAFPAAGAGTATSG